MQIKVDIKGNFNNILKWLKEAPKKKPNSSFQKLGNKGVSELRLKTPRDTGSTAMGWDYEVESTRNSISLFFVNRAHPELSVNVAKLIQYGHGTGTGGYVPPVNYIPPAMESVFNTAGNMIAKEVFK